VKGPASEVGEVLIPAEALQARVREIAAAISRDYTGKDLLLVCILRGAAFFLVDLARSLTIPAAIDFMAISSYGPGTKSSGVVRIIKDLDESVADRDVLIVEDIVDTGLTLGYLLRVLRTRGPASLEVCVLLDKAARRLVDHQIAYRGFEIPDQFVVGYGLDYQQRYRTLPYIAALRLTP
jgi:hypoxanthine phosphoribosyltransferase